MIAGIDFGTESSCVCVYSPAKGAEAIANDLKHIYTPSYISFTNSRYLIGEAAEARKESHATDTFYHVKRLLGRKFSDTAVQADIKHWPFKVQPDEEDNCILFVPAWQRAIPVVQVVAFFLHDLLATAQTRLGYTIISAVVTVPVCFTSPQRQAMLDACAVAGLQRTRLIDDTTAAALSYSMSRDTDICENVMVIDCGAGFYQCRCFR